MLDEFSEYLLEARVNTSADFDTYAVSYTNLFVHKTVSHE